MKKLKVGLLALGLCALAGCATLFGELGQKDATKAAQVCANVLADVEASYTIAVAQIKDPKELDTLAKAHAVVVASLQNCIAEGSK